VYRYIGGKMEEEIKTTIRIKREIYAEIKKLATIEGVTVSEFIEKVLDEYIKSQRSRSTPPS
jgi:predicted DNA-binding ribbon-helix-helix protein